MPETTDNPIDVPALVQNNYGDWTLDPTASSVEFHVKHFWGLMTVHGRFDKVSGEGRVEDDGGVSGQLQIAADSINTKLKMRDKHLRSEDFFDAEHHPTITITASGLASSGGENLSGTITLDAAGHQEALDTVVEVVDAAADALTLRAEANVDRTAFGMTWGPLGMTSPQARALVTARFVRK